jgi:hypothetical protein
MGIEPPVQSPENTSNSASYGAFYGALAQGDKHTDSGLTALIEAWATLPDAIRVGILAMIREGGKE